MTSKKMEDLVYQQMVRLDYDVKVGRLYNDTVPTWADCRNSDYSKMIVYIVSDVDEKINICYGFAVGDSPGSLGRSFSSPCARVSR